MLGLAIEKYGPGGLLATSKGRRWSGISAELRSHDGGVIAWDNVQPDTEICVDVRGSGSVVTRRGGGIINRARAERGMIWLSPAGLKGDFIDISDPLPGMLHLYLPPNGLAPDSRGGGIDQTRPELLRYERAFQDPLVAEIAFAILAELQTETSAGRLLVETLASSLAVRLFQNPRGVVSTPAALTQEGLDRRRLARVLEYIDSNLEGDLTVEHLASIACLSRFHFARSFKSAVGQSPHRYVSGKRLERAKVLLARGERCLADIALALNFSCQANFTRAFRDVTGLTPSQYRRNSAA
jgi:AraC family transcriptional regulator